MQVTSVAIKERRLPVGAFRISIMESCAKCPKLEACTNTGLEDYPAEHYCTLHKQYVYRPSKTNCRQRPRRVS